MEGVDGGREVRVGREMGGGGWMVGEEGGRGMGDVSFRG